MSNRVIHFFKYLEYEDLYNLGFKFETPVKNSLSTYIAKLKNPIFFILPKSEVMDILQDSLGVNKFKYIINQEDHPEFLTYLDNLDSLCINIAAENSELWFKKKVDTNVIVKYYNNLYNNDDDETGEYMVSNFEITDSKLLDELADYNEMDETNLMVCIEGIEFYKQTFKWKIVLDSIIETVDSEEENEENEDEEDDKDDLQFDKLISNSDTISKREEVINKVKEMNNLDKQSIRSELNIEKQIKKTNNDISSINKETIDDLADFETKSTLSIKRNPIVQQSGSSNNSQINNVLTKNIKNMSIKELESLIIEKKKDEEKNKENHSRAQRAVDILSKKVSDINSEIKIYEEKLNELSQTRSTISQISRR